MSGLTVLDTNPMPRDFPDMLRKLAIDVESGRVRCAIVVTELRDGGFDFIWPSSQRDSLGLASLALHRAAGNVLR